MVLLEVVGYTRLVTKFTFQGFYKEDQWYLTMWPLANLLGFYMESYPLVTAIPHRREPTTYPRAPGLSFGRKPQGHWASIPTFLPTKWIETSKSSLSLHCAEDRELAAPP